MLLVFILTLSGSVSDPDPYFLYGRIRIRVKVTRIRNTAEKWQLKICNWFQHIFLHALELQGFHNNQDLFEIFHTIIQQVVSWHSIIQGAILWKKHTKKTIKKTNKNENNKAGYMDTPVTCEWAGAEQVSWAFRQEP